MWTGYTAELVEKGMDFKVFVMRCAQAFGALAHMRDDPMDAVIPQEFVPSEYYTKSLQSAEQLLKKLRMMTDDEATAYGEKMRAEAIASMNEGKERAQAEDRRLLEMEDKVRAWQPPTADHEGLKKFMLEQIETSKNGFTGNYWDDAVAALNGKSAKRLFEEGMADAIKNIAYYGEKIEKETKIAASRTKWVKALRQSLEGV